MPFARSLHTGRLHYSERGEAHDQSLPALLIHGAGASSAIWMMTLARLGRATRAVAIDLPGHGPSPAAEMGSPPPSIAGYRDAVGALAAGLCLGRSVLIGHSMGALVAIEAALAWPDKVAALVLCGAGLKLPIHHDLLAVVQDDYDRFPAWLAEHGLSPAAKPALRRAFAAAGVAATKATTLADYAAIAACDLTERLKALSCPTAWLHGADDRIVPPPAAEILGPGHTVIVFPDAGHILPVEKPASVAEVTIRFAKEPGLLAPS
ncbi:MAG TPA: alpha/beta fold hydrolase [Polyangia bacterium]|nr:alpha/beta fold hydrolase [Polyangia bacterium]